ncbi:uncharacterized protein LOC143859646 [Tasmannia lanceolata]|uniref:uncharacterized protein LOC143859646 n=1 Tax=Tasmannia lanceolata TaxID=3420 RepID=UPI004063E577
MAQLFPISLVGIAKKWFLRLKPEEVRTMKDISDKLIEQFSMEEGIEVTKRDLKQLKQGPQQTFNAYIRRWKRKSAQLSQRLSEEEQTKLVIKSLSTQPSSSDIREGKMPTVMQKEVNSVNYVRPVAKTVTEVSKPAEKKAPRHFNPLPYPLPVILKKLIKDKDDDLLFLDGQCDELHHVTRGGCVFKPPELSAENPAEVVRAAENQRHNRLVTKEEDESLLKQLEKTQANIFVWSLLMASLKHRKLVLRELNAAQVSIETTPIELVSLVAMVRASRALSFTDEDLLPESRDHTNHLEITVICNTKNVPEVLVDNGFALNICPLSAATTLGFGPENFVPSEQGILAYDGTRRDVIGTLVKELQIGGEEFEIEFHVLNIKASFLLLLGRPWLHRVGVVPSTLHQKLKFIRNNRVVTLKGDPDLEIGQISHELTIGKAGDVSLTGFSLKVTAITMKEAMNEEIFRSSTNSNVVKMIRRQGYIPSA